MQPDNLFSPETEAAVLGAVLINPGVLPSLPLRKEHFYIHRHRYIWEVLDSLLRKTTPIDFVTVIDELERRNYLKDVGGPAYLTKLINDTPTSLHAEAHAQTLLDLARRRQWRDTAHRIVKLADDTGSDLEAEASQIVDELVAAVKADKGAVQVGEFAGEVLIEISDRRSDPKEIWGIPTGFADFDDITGGLQAGEILYISGTPGIGKSILAAQMGFQMAQARYPGVIYSLEMPGRQVVRRQLSALTKIKTRNLKTGRIDDGEFAAILEQVDRMEEIPLYMSDGVQWTTASLRADLARMKTQFGVQWFVLDYAYLLRDGQGLSENDRTGIVSAYLKAICRSLNLAGVVIHSLNKDGMSGVPGGVNLRGSGQQFYDTDLLLFLVASDIPNTVQCVFGKGRELENPQQSFQLRKLPGLPLMADASKPTVPQYSKNGR